MARKSRKTCRMETAVDVPAIAPEEQKIPTAVYCRLSKADEVTGRDDMDSQLEIIRQFVSSKGELEIVAEFTDDGFTGTNYNRPQFEEMMDGIREGRYKCMVVKDLSRLGRSYLETSDLLEMELPLYGCRFISVTDHIDSDISQMSDALKGFEVIDIEIGRSDSIMTVMGNMLKFNKATATELMHPTYVRMLLDAENKQAAIQACTEKTRNSVIFSKGEGKQVYAITVKVPAIVVAIRKLIPDLEENASLTFRGKLLAEDKAIVYDLTAGEPIKRRAKRKTAQEAEADEAEAEVDATEGAAVDTEAPTRRGRKKSQ